MKALLTQELQNKMILLDYHCVKMLNYGKNRAFFMISPIFGVIRAIFWKHGLFDR